MKKLLGLCVVAGLIVGSMGVPAEAAKKKKKKKKPVPVATPVNFYLRDTADDDCAEASQVLSTIDAPDEENCSFLTNGLPNEVLHAAGQEVFSNLYNAADGIPLVLDATKDATADLTVLSFTAQGVPVGGGALTIDVTVTGTIAGEPKEIAQGSGSVVVSPATPKAPVKIALKPDAALNGAQVADLQVTTTARGVGVLAGWISLDDPASFVTIPTLR